MELNKALEILEKITFYLELNDENVFKVNAYRNSVRTLKTLNVSLEKGISEKIFENTKGIGKAILSTLIEINDKGSSSLLQELEGKTSKDLYDLTSISGLGPKKIRKLYSDLNITNIGELEYAAKENRLIPLEGFGEKTQIKILSEINRINKNRGSLLLNTALDLADYVEQDIFPALKIKRYYRTGDLRRYSEIVNRLEFVIPKEEFNTNELNKLKDLKQVDSNMLEIYIDEIKVLLHLADESEISKTLLLTTGNKQFLLNNFGDQLPSAESEEQIFKLCNVEFVPSLLRDSAFTSKNSLIERSDIRGLLHIHTNYSDGSNSLEDMVSAAESAGFEYILVTDHSKSAFYANGLKEERLKLQWKEIEQLNKTSRIKILKGIECDILPDGSLDYPDNILKEFDCVIASVHSVFNLSEIQMTDRICNAIKNKYVKILGHPTGRLLLSREAYPINIDKVIETAKSEKKIIEFNSDPHRFDIDWRYHSKLKEQGVRIAINPDAHSIKGIHNIDLGTQICKKGGITNSDVINCLNLKDFLDFIYND